MGAKRTLRQVRFNPHAPGLGPKFFLTLWDTGRKADGKPLLGYRLTRLPRGETPAELLFEGENFSCSPLHAIDSDDAVAELMGFLTLRPVAAGDDYFRDYTPAQLSYCAEHAEALAATVQAWLAKRRSRPPQ